MKIERTDSQKLVAQTWMWKSSEQDNARFLGQILCLNWPILNASQQDNDEQDASMIPRARQQT